MRIPIHDPELKKRVNDNLKALRDGTVRRQIEEDRRNRQAIREKHRADDRELKRIVKLAKEVDAERRGLQDYLDDMLEHGEQWAGGIDETDHAIEGCQAELADLRERYFFIAGFELHIPQE